MLTTFRSLLRTHGHICFMQCRVKVLHGSLVASRKNVNVLQYKDHFFPCNMASVQNLDRQRRLWTTNDDLHFLLCYDNVWSTFWLVSLLRVIKILKISLVTEFQSVTDCTLFVLFVREFSRQPVGVIDSIGLQVIYQTREAVLNHISKHQAES